jgi:hypothetical protein
MKNDAARVPRKSCSQIRSPNKGRKRESKLPQFGTLNSIKPLVETPTQFAAQFQPMWSTRHMWTEGLVRDAENEHSNKCHFWSSKLRGLVRLQLISEDYLVMFRFFEFSHSQGQSRRGRDASKAGYIRYAAESGSKFSALAAAQRANRVC